MSKSLLDYLFFNFYILLFLKITDINPFFVSNPYHFDTFIYYKIVVLYARELMRIYVDLEPENVEEVIKLKKRMGCKTKTEAYRSVIVAGIETKKKEFGM